jgi:archaea-specific DNA-binding protein
MSTRGPAGPSGSPGAATVYIGLKPTMTYVFQVVAQLNSGAQPVVVRARGNAIAKAVDVVEVVRHRFLEGQVEVGRIETGTERLTNREGREANVSAISIPLSLVGPAPAERPSAPASLPMPE